MSAATALAVFVGAGCGACLRWLLNESLNHRWALMPLGTLAANLIGGYLVGVAIAVLALPGELSPLWRALVITGFLGGLTTFSAFSVEVVNALARGQPLAALATAALHLFGSLALTAAGIATVRLLS
jgi:CrcB protein